MSRRAYRTRYAAGPYRVIRLPLRRGFAIVDERAQRTAYAVTEPHPVHGRPVPVTMSLPRALETLRALTQPA